MTGESPATRALPLMAGVVAVVLLPGLLALALYWKRPQADDADGGGSGLVIRDPNPPGELVVNTVMAAASGNLQTVYTVKKGDSLWSISKKFGVSVAAITAANKDRSELLVAGGKLVIPAAP